MKYKYFESGEIMEFEIGPSASTDHFWVVRSNQYEFGFVLRFWRLSIREYLATRDPVSGTVYYVKLAVLAVVPSGAIGTC